jgi:hypothetical protein
VSAGDKVRQVRKARRQPRDDAVWSCGADYLISVTGKQIVVDRSRNFAEITKAIFSTDMDTLTLNVEKRPVGIITLA